MTAATRPPVVEPLSPATGQLVFRAVLGALARPGIVCRLPNAAAGPGTAALSARLPAALLPVLALADLTTPVCVLADGDGWDEVVRVATGAPSAGLPAARLVSVLRPLAPGELAVLRTGTVAVPEDGALACLAVQELAAAVRGPGPAAGAARPQRFRLAGPGIPGTRDLLVTGLPGDFAASRGALADSFPAGADLLLVTPGGEVAGLPRTTRTTLVTEEID